MKIIFTFFSIIILMISCNSSKEAVSKTKEPIIEKKEFSVSAKPSKESTRKKSDQIGEHYYTNGITYTTTSRVAFNYISISETDLLISKDATLQNIEKYSCDIKDWEALNALIKLVDMQNFKKLKAPTNKRLNDEASTAILDVRTGDMIIRSPSFDHGYPPKEIETIVNKVLSIAEKALKQ